MLNETKEIKLIALGIETVNRHAKQGLKGLYIQSEIEVVARYINGAISGRMFD